MQPNWAFCNESCADVSAAERFAQLEADTKSATMGIEMVRKWSSCVSRLLLVLTAGSVIPQELCMDGVRNPQEGIGEWERNFGKAATPSKKFN